MTFLVLEMVVKRAASIKKTKNVISPAFSLSSFPPISLLSLPSINSLFS
jgi:hypothetical protein